MSEREFGTEADPCRAFIVRGLLVHHKRDHRMVPAGARCSTWSLA